MKASIFLLISFMFIVSCSPEKKGDPTRFKKGVFEIPAGNSYGKTIITRIDSLQIEEYTKKTSVSTNNGLSDKEVKHIDTLFIKWKNNFAYTLRMKNPKTKLDKDPIFVQITKVTENSYEFTAKIGYSNFKQKGTVYKVK
ncbi:hypothetical protein [Tenacibaculum sp. 190524A02b]|uniref:hypothetical protein n=1 Tax=Tenacibaculum vairaonense TaxID=3137860 RepID=UPI0031FAD519